MRCPHAHLGDLGRQRHERAQHHGTVRPPHADLHILGTPEGVVPVLHSKFAYMSVGEVDLTERFVKEHSQAGKLPCYIHPCMRSREGALTGRGAGGAGSPRGRGPRWGARSGAGTCHRALMEWDTGLSQSHGIDNCVKETCREGLIRICMHRIASSQCVQEPGKSACIAQA